MHVRCAAALTLGLLAVYDALGRTVRVLVTGEQAAVFEKSEKMVLMR